MKRDRLSAHAPPAPAVAGKSDETVAAIQRALALLDAFGVQDSHLTLSELSRRARIPKTTALRVLRTLGASKYVVQTKNGTWRLGPAVAWLGTRYRVAFDLNNTIEPVLEEVARLTKESASFYVYDGNMRNCLLRAKGPRAHIAPVRIGEPMPLHKGSPGQVILAFTGREGKLYEEIRQRGFHYTIREYSSNSAGVSAPVFGTSWSVVGALCVSGPAENMTEERLLALAPTVTRAARRLSYELSRGAASPRTKATSLWPIEQFAK